MPFKDIPEFDFKRPATKDNLLDFIKTLICMANKQGPGWENLRYEMVKFSCDLLNAWKGKSPPKVGELAPRIWDFYCGYISCHQDWARELDRVIDELPADSENLLDKMWQ